MKTLRVKAGYFPEAIVLHALVRLTSDSRTAVLRVCTECGMKRKDAEEAIDRLLRQGIIEERP